MKYYLSLLGSSPALGQAPSLSAIQNRCSCTTSPFLQGGCVLGCQTLHVLHTD